MSRNQEFDFGLPPDTRSDHDRRLLAFARDKAGAYVTSQESLQHLGITSEVFYQRLNRILDDPVMQNEDPQSVDALRQVRSGGVSAITRDTE